MHSRRGLDLGSMNHVDIGRKGIDAPCGLCSRFVFLLAHHVPGSSGPIMTFGVVIDAEFTQSRDRKT